MNNAVLILILILFGSDYIVGQTKPTTRVDGSRQSNVLTAVPFLLITPHPKAGAMGNAGVAVEADANAAAVNSSSLAFLPEGTKGVSVSYSPWLRTIAPGMSLSYLGAYARLDKRSTIATSLRYFDVGDVNFTDNNFGDLGLLSPSEFAFDVSYIRSFGPRFALGGTVRYIHSSLFSGQAASGRSVEAGKAISVDVSGIYKNNSYFLSLPAAFSIGLNLSNIGTKINYGIGRESYFLPANFRLGTAVALTGEDGVFTVALDINKLMVPTQPIYDQEGNIVKGRDPNRSVTSGIFSSFIDAPNGFSEELKEVGISTGIEYKFKDLIAFRTGYNYQNPQKGNNSYFTIGTGLKYQALTFDFAYLLASTSTSALANTLRFGLQVDLSRKVK
ncbi:type IX secretion system outer membrane channel protein PorV [Mucilaginibacter terrae]|uniref:type IX secretion system outer membrane channel protein PorV n=1 Tax=Mucilaginibacter terrae TaxID=1955052 RepID=UPI00362B193E